VCSRGVRSQIPSAHASSQEAIAAEEQPLSAVAVIQSATLGETASPISRCKAKIENGVTSLPVRIADAKVRKSDSQRLTNGQLKPVAP
jgi:hypothetical protein